jgi:RNA polymerase sigma-70 factor (ECF subfamily)
MAEPTISHTDEQWLAALRGPERNKTLMYLREVLVRGLRVALKKRPEGVCEADIEDFAQEALVKILHNLDSYRGESRFTTWAQKIALHFAFTELRRRKWRDVSLQELLARGEATGARWDPLKDPLPVPEELMVREITLATMQRLMSEELTDRQHKALVAVLLRGMSPEEAARRMDTNRNALYKLMHDARKKLKKRLIAEGFCSQDMIEAFAER